jgi:hypothetical protein
MTIIGITPTGRVSALTADTPPTTAFARSAVTESIDALGNGFDTPRPVRFPWLARLSTQLAAASPQRAAFAPAPVLGDNVDQSV